MKNIIKIFRMDYRRLTASVVAAVTVMGLCIIPCLYAWFNIFSNWNPYGEAAISNIKIAVVNQDCGYSLMGVRLNVGEQIVSSLKGNKQMGWVFPDSEKEAVEGVYASSYYAALIMPKSFTQDFLSFTTSDLRHPQIIYYENDKMNAIAPKITNKAKTAVQDEINATFIKTIADAITTLSSVFKALGLNADDISKGLTSSLDNADSGLEDLAKLLGALKDTTRDAGSLLKYSDIVVDDLGRVTHSGQSIINKSQSRLTDREKDILAVLNTLSQTDTGLREISSNIKSAFESLNSYDDFVSGSLESTLSKIDQLITGLHQAEDSAYVQDNPALKAQLEEAINRLMDLRNTLSQLKPGEIPEGSLASRAQELIAKADSTLKVLQMAALSANTSVSNALTKLFDSSKTALSNVKGLLGAASGDLDSISSVLGGYETALGQTMYTLDDAIKLVQDLDRYLDSISNDLNRLVNSDTFKQFIKALEENPEKLAERLSSPIELKNFLIYEIKNYGSAMSPYYVMLSLFVGSLLASTFIHVEVGTSIPDAGLMRPYQRFWGRFILFFIIGQVQALITSIGCLLYIGIQCLDPWLFILGCSICSLSFSMMNYALVYSLDNIGMAISVIVMVIQVAGSGGSYPIDVLPPIFRRLYPFMPFHYGMDMLRETIGGRYDSYYWKNLLVMLAFTVFFMFFGLLMYFPARRLNEMITRSKQSTGIM